MNKTTGIIIAVVLVILAAVGGFFGGMYFQKSKTGNSRFALYAGGMMGEGRQGGFGRGGMMGQNGGGIVRGQILSIDNNNMTVKLADGSSKIVVLGSSTTFVQSSKASQSDVKQGDTVMVFGTTNSDGSVTAQNVQLNPQQMMRPIPSTTPAQ